MDRTQGLDSLAFRNTMRMGEDVDRVIKTFDGMAPALRAVDQALRTRGIAGLMDRPEARGIAGFRRRAEQASGLSRAWTPSPALSRLRSRTADLEASALTVEALERPRLPAPPAGLQTLDDESEAFLEEVAQERREQTAAEAQYRREILDLLEASDQRAAEAEVSAHRNARATDAAITIAVISTVSGLGQDFSPWRFALTSLCVVGAGAAAWSAGVFRRP